MLSSACVRASASDIDIPEDCDAGDGGTISVTAQKPQQDQPHRPQATAGLLSRPASHRSLASKRHRSTPPSGPAHNAHLSYITGGKPIWHIPSHPLASRSAQADFAAIMMAGRAGKGVASETTGKPLIGQDFPKPQKLYYTRTHIPRRATHCSESIISCTTVRRVCMVISDPQRRSWLTCHLSIWPG